MIGGSGCGLLGGSLDDGGGTGTTGGGPEDNPACFVQGGCNGAFTYCFNDNGLDETGADGGEQNHWFDFMDPTYCEQVLGG